MLLFEFQFCSGNTESALLVLILPRFIGIYYLQAGQRVRERNQAMASKSRPSRRPAAQHATLADLVVETPSARVQAGSDRGRPRTSVGGVGAVSEPSVGHVAETDQDAATASAGHVAEKTSK